MSTSSPVLGTINNRAVQTGTAPPPLSPLGICLAKAQLFQSLDPILGTITFTTSESILREDFVPNGSVVGYVMEFDAQATSATSMRFRTVAYLPNGTDGNWETQLEAPTKGHPRGWWSHSDLSANLGSFDVTPTPQPVRKFIACCMDGGVEEGVYGTHDDDPNGRINEGLFGVDLSYNCQVTCEGAGVGNLYAYVLAMHTESQYFGAGEIASWQNLPDRGIAPLLWADPDSPPPHPLNAVELTQSGPLIIFQSTPQTLEIRVANAGAATMPFLIVLSNLSHNINP